MKWMFVLVLALSPLYAAAAPWGAVANYTEPKAGQTSAKRPGERYLIAQILDGRPIRAKLTLAKDSTKYQSYEKIISQGYNRWFQETAQQIRAACREKEFAVILPLLEKGVPVRFVGEVDEADIEFLIVPFKEVGEYCRGAAGCYIHSDQFPLPQIVLPQDNIFWRVVSLGEIKTANIGLHEIGHSLGLSDQYERARSLNSHPLYSTEETYKNSVMYNATSLSCDDADGIINLIDLTRGFSRGGELGWRSLCKKSDVVYVRSAPLTKGPYVITALDQGKKWRLEAFDKGSKKAEYVLAVNLYSKSMPLEDISETVFRRDSAGRPLSAKSSEGEEVYYSYVYDRKVRLAVRNGEVTNATVWQPVYKKNKRNEKLFSVYFGEGGGLSVIGYTRPYSSKGKKGTMIYIGGLDKREKSADVSLEFDAKGNIIKSEIVWPSSDQARTTTDSAIGQTTPATSATRASSPAGMESKIRRSLRHSALVKEREKKIEDLVEWYLRQSY